MQRLFYSSRCVLSWTTVPAPLIDHLFLQLLRCGLPVVGSNRTLPLYSMTFYFSAIVAGSRVSFRWYRDRQQAAAICTAVVGDDITHEPALASAPTAHCGYHRSEGFASFKQGNKIDRKLLAADPIFTEVRG